MLGCHVPTCDIICFLLQVISDWLLIAGVMVLLGVDLIILTVFTIIEQAGIGGELIRLTENREYPTEVLYEFVYIHYINYC